VAASEYNPSPAERADAPRHVTYELKMLRAALDAHERVGKSDEWAGAALAESALVHMRNLHEFLTALPSARDNIVAGQFARNPDGTPWVSNRLTLVGPRICDMHRRLMHLTYERVAGGTSWPLRDLHTDVEIAFSDFVERLPKGERSSWLG
jgi:hypothetical protein